MTPMPPNPPGVPPQTPSWPMGYPPPPPPQGGRGVSFFIAIFLGILLIASAGLNVLLLVLSVGSFASAGLGVDVEDQYFDEVYVAGQRSGEPRAAKVLQITIRGAIAEDQNPVLGAAGGTVSQVRRGLRRAAADDVRGVLLYIDSPGGGVTDSDEIYELVRRFRSEHPDKRVLTLFGDIAASGGYYVAVASERILARRTTITGSIGVIMSAWNFTEAAKKLGVDQVAIKSERTPYKDMLSMTRPMQPAECQILTDIVDELYDRFVTVVDDGRPGLDRAQVVAAANGAVYSASKAKELGLVDDIGDHDTVVAWFGQQLGSPVTIVEQRRRATLGQLLFGALQQRAGPQGGIDRLLTTSTGPRFLYYWEGAR